MKSCVNRKIFAAAFASLAAVLLSWSCTREGDGTLGSEFIPDGQRLEMRHKSFYAGKVIKYDVDTKEYITDENHKIFETTLYRTDSIVSSNISSGYMGVQDDPQAFGKRTAGFASEFLFMSDIDEEGFGYKPIFDSLQMLLSITDFGGDTTRVITYEVYEVITSIEESMTERKDDGEKDDDATVVAYINHDMTPLYDRSKRLFTFRFPDQENGVYTTSKAVTMTPDGNMSADSPAWDFVRRLMLVEDAADWDGYADNTEIYLDDKKWVEAFKGLYIKPVDDLGSGEEGGMYATDLSASGFYLYGRNRNPEEPRLVKDTVHMQYLFYDQYATSGNNSINSVAHDYSGSAALASATMGDDTDRESHTLTPKGYIDGMGGPVMEIYLTDDFLDELHAISTEDEFKYGSFNQAKLYVYIEGSDYDWMKLVPETITPLLDVSMTRLGLYTNYNHLTPVPDYNYVYEVQYDTSLAYGGNLGRSMACYVMDISVYMQRLKNYVDSLHEKAGGAVDYGKHFDEDDEGYIARTLYLAPEAYGLYTFKRSTVQGMEDASNNASMRIEMTYTMIKGDK